MQFQVPQFIEIEDKIIGPFTVKQFIYLVGGAGMDFIILKYKRVRELFTNYEIFDKEIPHCSPPEFLKLNEFLMSQNIRYNIELIKKDLTFEPVFSFEE